MHARDLFEILVREHADMLTVYLRSVVRDPAAVDDLFQETMIVAWKTLDRFDKTRPFGPWLRGIAARLILAYRRKTAGGMLLCDEQTLAHLDQRLTSLARQPGDNLDEKLEGLRGCLAALPEPYRQAIELRYRQELPAATVAERLELSLEALKKQLQRGRARLLDCLQRKLALAEAHAT
jgi:RNA polymerase sigma-70 factor